MTDTVNTPDPRRVRRNLLRWYERDHRDLPWRGTDDPYAIWVSETMLQQTQVTTVIPYYRRFLERFPDLPTLAASNEDEVLALWSGLGYYRRARALRDGARAVMDRHGGRLPDDPEALLALPGIGRYTSGAIASIAFDRPEPILDGNVRRVLSRVFAVGDGTPAEQERLLWGLAGKLVRGRSPGNFNQSMMELGARLCTPKEPRCPRCPIADDCLGLATGEPERFPLPRRRPPTRTQRVVIGWVYRGNGILLERPPEGSPLRGRWDLPAVELGGGTGPADSLVGALRTRYDLEARLTDDGIRASHGIMQRRLRIEVVSGRLSRGGVARRSDLRWASRTQLASLPVSGATLKIARLMRV